MDLNKEHKIIVIGSGPAGCTAALYLSRANLAPLVVEGLQPGGQLTITTEVENFPGFPNGVLGPDLMSLMNKQAGRFGAVFQQEDVESVDLRHHPFQVKTDRGLYECYALVIASGASAMQLGLPSEKALQGFGVSYCATCDAFFFKGTGNRSDRRRRFCHGRGYIPHEIRFQSHGHPPPRRASRLQDHGGSGHEQPQDSICLQHRGRGSDGSKDEGVKGLRLRNLNTGQTSEFPCQGLFVAIGHSPNTRVFEGQLELDEKGYIVTHPNSTKTNIEGVFACGDAVDHIYRQAITAAGTGCMAALDCERWLTHERITERWGLEAGEEGRI